MCHNDITALMVFKMTSHSLSDHYTRLQRCLTVCIMCLNSRKQAAPLTLDQVFVCRWCCLKITMCHQCSSTDIILRPTQPEAHRWASYLHNMASGHDNDNFVGPYDPRDHLFYSWSHVLPVLEDKWWGQLTWRQSQQWCSAVLFQLGSLEETQKPNRASEGRSQRSWGSHLGKKSGKTQVKFS